MTNKKISALPSSTTPLVGSELVPIVQGGVTSQVSVDNLTAGKTVYGLNFRGSSTATTYYTDYSTGNGMYAYGVSGTYPNTTRLFSGSALTLNLDSSQNTTFSTGNLIQGTAAKGINFTANTPAAGMTSQLLNWYEEGAWTPSQGAGLTVVGAFSAIGYYTRIGRTVHVSGTINGATSVAAASGSIMCGGLPFASSAAQGSTGSMINATLTASGVIFTSGNNIWSVNTMAATSAIPFSATYFI